jgi:hypothetical protein
MLIERIRQGLATLLLKEFEKTALTKEISRKFLVTTEGAWDHFPP